MIKSLVIFSKLRFGVMKIIYTVELNIVYKCHLWNKWTWIETAFSQHPSFLSTVLTYHLMTYLLSARRISPYYMRCPWLLALVFEGGLDAAHWLRKARASSEGGEGHRSNYLLCRHYKAAHYCSGLKTRTVASRESQSGQNSRAELDHSILNNCPHVLIRDKVIIHCQGTTLCSSPEPCSCPGIVQSIADGRWCNQWPMVADGLW